MYYFKTDVLEQEKELFNHRNPKFEPVIEDAAMDFNMAIILVLAIANRFNLVLVGQDVLLSAANAIGCKYSCDVAGAVKNESKFGNNKMSVSLIPAGGYIYPILSEPFELF